jgi:hypothetical protein
MKYRYVAGVVALSLCVGAAFAQAQYYDNSPPPAGPYPPPPGRCKRLTSTGISFRIFITGFLKSYSQS